MRIQSILPELQRVPLPRPWNRLGTAERGRLTFLDVLLVEIQAENDLSGLGFSYLLGAGGIVLPTIVAEVFAPLLVGRDAGAVEQHFAIARQETAGWSSFASHAYAAIDLALWDLRGKTWNAPLYRILGSTRSGVPAFVSDVAGLAQPLGECVKACKAAIDSGFRGVLVQLGGYDRQADADRLAKLRAAVTESAWLSITAEERYDRGTALTLGPYFEEDIGLDWFESPLPSDDLLGYRDLADRLDIPVAAGTEVEDRFQLDRLIQSGVRVARLDLLRLGGLTPLLKLIAHAEAAHLPVIPLRLPEVGIHLACGLNAVPMVDHVDWLKPLFRGGPRLVEGYLRPSELPGLGLERNPAFASGTGN